MTARHGGTAGLCESTHLCLECQLGKHVCEDMHVGADCGLTVACDCGPCVAGWNAKVGGGL